MVNKGLFKGQNNQNMNRNQPRFKLPSQSKLNEQSGRTKVKVTNIPPVHCWGCGGPHYVKNCPHRKRDDQISQIQASTMGELARSIPKINVALEDH